MRLLFTISMVTASCVLLNAQQGRCVKGNCSNGYGEYLFSNGDEYKGNFQNGKIEGQGILYFKNGDKYVGHWANQQPQGRGRFTFANGDEYLGEFGQGKFHGVGKLTYTGGARYEGGFAQGLFEGQGTMRYADGAVYTGWWRAGKREGAGTLQLANGETLQGEWQQDQYKAAWGKIAFQGDTASLRNCNLSFCASGLGKYTYKDGARFIGDFRDGKPEGVGIVFFKNGDRYEGQWNKDQPNGKGIMYYKGGITLGAMWEAGRPVQELFREEHKEKNSLMPVEYDRRVKIWAVVIGAARYTHMPVLRYTDDDAYQIYAFLKSPEGGALPDNQVRLLIDEDATRNNILYAMRSVFARADENDVVIFYFSGHGIQGAFLPIDYDGSKNLLTHAEVRDLLLSSRAKHKIVLADACHSGGLLAVKSPTQLEIQKLYTAFEESKGGMALFMSSKGEEYSLEDGGLRSGVFSHFIIRGLKGEADQNANNIVSIQELFNYVYRHVRKYTANAQTPIISGAYDPEMPVALVRKP